MSEVRIRCVSNLDMASITQLEDLIERSLDGHEGVVLDMSELEFIDSTGVRGLISLRRKLIAMGKSVRMEQFRPEIMDILDILGVQELVL